MNGTDSQIKEKTHSDMAGGLVRSLNRRYAVVLTAVAALVVIDQAVIQPLLVRLSGYAPVINVAGRQRMLSQRLTKAALANQRAQGGEQMRTSQQELRETLQQWTTAHDGLIDGNAAMNLPGTTSQEIRAAFVQLEPDFLAMQSAAESLLQSPERSGDQSNLADQRATGVHSILIHEREYLPAMDRIVGMYEAEARQQVAWLRFLELTIMLCILVLLASLGVGVLRPAQQVIRRQVDELSARRDHLEARVAQRTDELVAANERLRKEMLDRQAAELQTQQLSRQLAHASRVTAIGQLATGLAHELNQPLSAVTNYAQGCELLLQREEPDLDRAKQFLSGISRAALRAGSIIGRMRNFLRSGGNEFSEVEFSNLLGEVQELLRAEASRADVDLNWEIPQHLPKLRVDAIQIQQVLVNLIQNSMQAMSARARDQRRLAVTAQLEDDILHIAVSDSGPGLPADELDEIFAPFFTTKPNGLGMGLSISRSIVNRHGGRLWAENKIEGGATVYFTLPLDACPATEIEEHVQSVCR